MTFPDEDNLPATLAALPTRAEQKAYLKGRYDVLLLMQQLNPEVGEVSGKVIGITEAYTCFCNCCETPLQCGNTACLNCGY